MTALARVAQQVHGYPATVQMVWTLDDPEQPYSEVIAGGRQALSEVADRYEFCVIDAKWIVDGPMLAVTAEVIHFRPGRLTLVDDTESGVPS